MKTTLFFACFLLFLFTTEAVLVDTNGYPIRNGGGAYLISPVVYGPLSSDIKLANASFNEQCPLAVIQNPFDHTPGSSFSFVAMHRAGFLSTGDLVRVSSAGETACNDRAIWTVEGDEGIITTHGPELAPYCFKILDHPSPLVSVVGSYMLQYCCGADKTCLPIHLYSKDGFRVNLATSTNENDRPFEFVLQNVVVPLSSL